MFSKISYLTYFSVFAVFVLPLASMYFNNRRRENAIREVNSLLNVLAKHPQKSTLDIFWRIYFLMQKFEIEPNEVSYDSLESIASVATNSYQSYLNSLNAELNRLNEMHVTQMRTFFQVKKQEAGSVPQVSIGMIIDLGARIRRSSEEVMGSSTKLIVFKNKLNKLLSERRCSD